MKKKKKINTKGCLLEGRKQRKRRFLHILSHPIVLPINKQTHRPIRKERKRERERERERETERETEMINYARQFLDSSRR